MPNPSTIAIDDNTPTTPVTYTFKKSKVNGDTAYYVAQNDSSALGNAPLTISLRAPLANQAEKLWRHKTMLSLPVLQVETINAVARPTLVCTLRSTVEYVIPSAANEQSRETLHELTVGVQGDGEVRTSVVELLNFT